ncbi:hypothetical protein L596_017180 [Steinernema carpocapsae]|uniref:Uncharacterized protein n=1 Tax=Steinernema carpocapsae TaxID=34508 RepID=A0A4U5N1K4_STECR|nr:hypothetical protein L596_017180 [Steinernema carpocapsae]
MNSADLKAAIQHVEDRTTLIVRNLFESSKTSFLERSLVDRLKIYSLLEILEVEVCPKYDRFCRMGQRSNRL